jgi:hypothetical protein
MGFSASAVPPGCVHLQGVGDVKGTKVRDLKAGDRIMWNFGYVYEVVDVRPVTATLWELTERSLETGKTYKRRKKPDTYIACARDGKFQGA